MRLTEEQIKEINAKQISWNMGVYKEPSKIPTNVKGLVLYQRSNCGGHSGGNCWNDDEPTPYSVKVPEFTILDDVLEIIKPDITFLEYKKIKSLINELDDIAYAYYGNSDEYRIRYLALDDLYNFLNM